MTSTKYFRKRFGNKTRFLNSQYGIEELDEEEKRTMWLVTVKDLESDAEAKGRAEAIIQFCQEGLLLKSQALEELKALSEKLSPDFYQKCVDEVMDIIDKD